MIHTPKVSFAHHRECYFDRTYIQQRKYEIRARFSLLCLRSFFFPIWCPQLILPLSILQRPNVYEEEKNRHRESKRDSKTEIETRRIPRTTHALSRDVHMRRERERLDRNKKRTKSIPRETIEGFSPAHNNEFSFLCIERLCLFEYKAKTENKRREIKETEKASILPCLCLFSEHQ